MKQPWKWFAHTKRKKTEIKSSRIGKRLKEMAEQRPELVKKYYSKLADTSKDGVTAFNTAFAQDATHADP